MVKTKQQLIDDNSRIYGRENGKKYITVHQTGNTKKGAGAQSHANLQTNGNARSASWHWQVDDKIAIQSFTHDAQCWHAGDGRGDGNLNSIAVELCINQDADYKTTVENGAKLVKKIMKDEGIPLENVKQHADWSNKNCPAQIRAGQDGIDWDAFLEMVENDGQAEATSGTTKTKSKSKSDNGINLKVDGEWGKQTTEALQKYLGTVEDGIISDQLRNRTTDNLYGGTVEFGDGSRGSMVIRALQDHLGYNGRGILGQNTVRRLQTHLGTTRDGYLSRPSQATRALQQRLNDGTL